MMTHLETMTKGNPNIRDMQCEACGKKSNNWVFADALVVIRDENDKHDDQVLIVELSREYAVEFNRDQDYDTIWFSETIDICGNCQWSHRIVTQEPRHGTQAEFWKSDAYKAMQKCADELDNAITHRGSRSTPETGA